MCGITGFWNPQRDDDTAALQNIVQGMTDTILHRGPDDSGAWVDAAAGVALGFRRLAIVDLSPTGHQPMHSADDRYVIVFNGEVYNFLELREELSALGPQFPRHLRHRSDAGGHLPVGIDRGCAALQWHVCLCPVGLY